MQDSKTTLLSSSSHMPHPKAQTQFLSALRLWIEDGVETNLLSLWQTLCQHYVRASDLSEWGFLCRKLHEICQEGWLSDQLMASASEQGKHRLAALIAAQQDVFPAVAVMTWEIKRCKDATEATQRIGALKASLSGTLQCTLFYWEAESTLHFRYVRSDQAAFNVALSPTSAISEHQPNPIVENILGLVTVQDALVSDPQLTAELLDTVLMTLPCSLDILKYSMQPSNL